MEHGARHNEKRPLEAFEYSILRSLMPLALSQRTLFLGVSGGLDSVAMMHIMHRLVPYLDCQMAVIHVHHGRGSATQEEFRRGSYDFVKSLCKEYQVPFHSNFQPPGTWTLIPEAPLRAEGELREIRFKVFEEAMKKAPPSGNPLLTLAHHADDLLETRMMRLIRGVGPQGVQAMVNYDGKILRPLLTLSRNSLLEYAKNQGLEWLDDPSNENLEPLRNWMRHKWLPELESRQPGAVQRLGQSLQALSEAGPNAEESWAEGVFSGPSFSRQFYLELSVSGQKRLLARFMRQQGMKNYSQSHIEEVLKRLDKSQKDFTFSLLKYSWKVSPTTVTVTPIQR